MTPADPQTGFGNNRRHHHDVRHSGGHWEADEFYHVLSFLQHRMDALLMEISIHDEMDARHADWIKSQHCWSTPKPLCQAASTTSVSNSTETSLLANKEGKVSPMNRHPATLSSAKVAVADEGKKLKAPPPPPSSYVISVRAPPPSSHGLSRQEKVRMTTDRSRPLIEVSPGKMLPLRRARETMDAIARMEHGTFSCWGCQAVLQSVADCQVVICQACRWISPGAAPAAETIDPAATTAEDGGGVGLGLVVRPGST